MPSPRSPNRSKDTLSVKLGSWLEAHATGWGVIAIPIVLVLVMAGVLLKGYLHP